MILAGAHAGAGAIGRASAPRPRPSRRLQHPNIVQIYEVGEHDGRPFFSLEFVDGGSLADKLAGQAAAAAARPPSCSRRWPAPSTPPTSSGIVHRDLKPANVLLDRRRHAQDHRLRPGQAASTSERGT